MGSTSLSLSTTYLDLQFIEELPLESWKTLLAAFGKPPGIDKLSHEAIAKVLLNPDQPKPQALIDALDELHDLASDSGREALHEATLIHSIDTKRWKNDETAPELAVRLVCESRQDSKLRKCVLHARVLVWDKLVSSKFQEFAGRTPQAPARTAAKSDRFRQAVSDWCKSHDRGDYAEVLTIEDVTDLRLEVFHGHRQQAPLVIENNARFRRPIRMAHCDSIRYDATLGRLRIAARSAPMINFYRALFGKIFFGDSNFFAHERICSLAAIQQKGQLALDAHGLGHAITRARIKELLWKPDDRDSIWLRSPDCLEAANRLNLNISTGQLLEAKIELCFRAGRNVRVSVKVPNRIDFRRNSRADLVDAYLSQVEIRGSHDDDQVLDLWTMAPWRHSLQYWRNAIGEHTDKLVAQSILKQVRLESVTNFAQAGASMPIRVAEDATFDGESFLVGITDDDLSPSRILTTSDIEGLALDPLAYAKYVRAQLALNGSIVREVLSSGMYFVGTHQIDSTEVSFYLLMRQPMTKDMIVAATSGSRVLLVPPGKSSNTGLPEIELKFPLPSVNDVVRQAIHQLGIEDGAAAIDVAPRDAQLVYDPRTKDIWLLGSKLVLDGQLQHLLEILITKAPLPVATSDIDNQLGSNRSDKGAGKQAKQRLTTEIKRQVPKLEGDLIVAERGKGYRLTLTPWTPKRKVA